MKSGLGTSSYKIPGTDVVVGAIVAVDAGGDVVDPQSGKVVAGVRAENGKTYRNTMKAIMNGERVAAGLGTNTTIGAVATNAAFTRTEMTKIAQMALDAFPRAINPVDTTYDGGTVFPLSTRESKTTCDAAAIGAIAATVMARAMIRAVMQAAGLPKLDLPAYRDYAGKA